MLIASGLCFSLVHVTLKSAFSSLAAERDRLRHSIDLQAPQPAQVIGLKTAYASVSGPALLFHKCSPFIATGLISLILLTNQECASASHSLVHQVSNESKASIPESISEFFDAQEYLLSSSSSEVRHLLSSFFFSSSTFKINNSQLYTLSNP